MAAIRRASIVAAVAATLAVAAPALAHHPMGGQTPRTFLHGLLSGFGHPVIGLDHLAAIIGVGLLAALIGAGPASVLAFVGAMIGGVALHLASVDVPGAELLVALSTTLIGLVVATRLIASPTLAVGLFGAAGLVHGYALGESIIGAEPTPLAAYFVGLAVVQCVIAGAAYFAALHLGTTTERLAPRSVTAAGSVIALTGVYFAASAAGLLA